MKTAFKPNLKSKPLFFSKSCTRLRVYESGLIDYKFYQKLFVVLISLSSILIFLESPRELENICQRH